MIPVVINIAWEQGSIFMLHFGNRNNIFGQIVCYWREHGNVKTRITSLIKNAMAMLYLQYRMHFARKHHLKKCGNFG